jgi:ectoine hydroxylase-related dioxygenase (phytanoyl-CoA dioxygenase family)
VSHRLLCKLLLQLCWAACKREALLNLVHETRNGYCDLRACSCHDLFVTPLMTSAAGMAVPQPVRVLHLRHSCVFIAKQPGRTGPSTHSQSWPGRFLQAGHERLHCASTHSFPCVGDTSKTLATISCKLGTTNCVISSGKAS